MDHAGTAFDRECVKREAFMAQHWNSVYEGVRVHEWVAANALRLGGWREAWDQVRTVFYAKGRTATWNA